MLTSTNGVTAVFLYGQSFSLCLFPILKFMLDCPPPVHYLRQQHFVCLGHTCSMTDMKERLTSLSSPNRITMKKNNMDHRGATGISATAAGYATNAKPGPDNVCDNNKNYIVVTF